MRITVIGLPASGKTSLAQKLGEKLSIPHIQIDRFWFEAGGLGVEQGLTTLEETEKIRAVVRARVHEAIKADSWVSDGFYGRYQSEISDRAEKIIYLNIPLGKRLWAHAKRIFRPGRHVELSFWNELKFFVEIIQRTIRRGPVIRKFVEEHRDKIIELRSWKEINVYVTKIVA